MLKLWAFIKGIILKPEVENSNTDSSKAIEGSVWVDDTSGSNKLKSYLAGGDREVATLDQTQVFSNKKFSDPTEFQDDVLISGDLNVTGEFHANNLILDTKDNNITLNKGGDDGQADSGGLTIDRTNETVNPGPDGSIVYDSTLLSGAKWRAGDLGSELELLDVSNPQDLSNKTFIDEATFTEIGKPSNPVLTEHKLYPKNDGKFYTLNSAGDEVPLGSGGITKVALYDSVTPTLITGTSVTIDGAVVQDGDQVLFSNLLVDNNRIYEATSLDPLIPGSAIVSWTAKANFSNGVDPINSDMIVAQKGDAFAQQVGVFDGTDWSFNDTVRHFNGVDYYEVSSLITSTLADTSLTGDVFTVATLGSENMIIDYSLNHGASSDLGQIYITVNGTNISTSRFGTNIADTDIELLAAINGSDIELNYTAGTISSRTMKYSIKRWSNATGGPGGVPSYTSVGGSDVAAAGVISNIQFHGSDGNMAADVNYSYDVSTGQVDMAGLKVQELSADITINDNQAAPAFLIQYPITEKYNIIEYSIEKQDGGSNLQVRIGRLLIPSNGIIINHSDDFSETASTGVVLTVVVNGANIEVQYVSTTTGFSGIFKYSLRKW